MIFGYVTQNYIPAMELKSHISDYADKNNIEFEKIIVDQQNNRTDWQLRGIRQLLDTDFGKGDALVVYDASCIGRSTAQLLEFFEFLVDRAIDCHFVKYAQVFRAQGMEVSDLLKLLGIMADDFVCKRTKEALARRKANGLPIGRPMGRKNKKLKLDQHREDIQRYLDLGVSKASIAKIIGCHVQTFYNYIEMRNLKRAS